MSWQDLTAAERHLLETICTPKELDVLKLQAAGMSTRQIGRYLGLSRSTVQSRIYSARDRIARAKEKAA